MTVRVALDLWPAILTLPSGGKIKPARVYVVDNELIAYIMKGGEPTVYFRRPILSHEGNRLRGWDFQVEDGTVKVVRVPGCGCGNKLKRFNPWQGQTRVAVSL